MTIASIERERSSSRTARPLTVLFDTDCAFCTRTAGWLARLDRSRRLRLVPLQSASTDLPAVAALAAARHLSTTLHVVHATGDLATGGEAVLRICEAVPQLRPLAVLGRFPVVRPLVEPLYRLVARHRGGISRAIGTACGVPRHPR